MGSLQQVQINLDVYRDNLVRLKELVAPAKVMAVVKADAYGHGAIAVAKAAESLADWLGVVTIDEALALREAGIKLPILAWQHAKDSDFYAATVAGITLGLSYSEQLKKLAVAVKQLRSDSKVLQDFTAQVHLKVDTGLGRNGSPKDCWRDFFTLAKNLETEKVIKVSGIFSHLSNTSDADDEAQHTQFEAAITLASQCGLDPKLRHLAATGRALSNPDYRYDMVRLGIGTYGLSPDGRDMAQLGLHPVMRLTTEVITVKRVSADTPVSYGYLYRTSRETTLALVPFGYADGAPRQASNPSPKNNDGVPADTRIGLVSINGKKYPIAGRIAMDQFVVDVGDAKVSIGDPAIIWGDPDKGEPSADDWARAADTINYEIVTRVGSRPDRCYLERDGN